MNKLPESERQSVRNSIPDLPEVHNAVRSAMLTWQEKRDSTKLGKVKKVFEKVYQSCDDHSSLLSIIPNDDKYVSLIAGSLTAIAKVREDTNSMKTVLDNLQATINHQNIAEAISDTLNELCDDINFCKRLVSPHSSNSVMMRLVRELYIVFFEFLTDVFTKWSASRWDRIKSSFDKSAFDGLFTSKRQRMKDIRNHLKDEADLANRSREEQNRRRTQETLLSIERNLAHLLRDNLETKRLFSLLGWNAQRFLEESDLMSKTSTATSVELPCLQDNYVPTIGAPEHLDQILGADTNHQQTYFRKDILVNHPKFQELLLEHDQNIRDLIDRAYYISIDTQVARRVSTWAGSLERSCLWVQGPAYMAIPSHNTLAATWIVALAEKSQLPVLSYLCQTSQPSRLNKEQRFCKMLLSLIAQAMRFLPEEISTHIDLSFQRLDASIAESAGAPELLSLLQDLISLIPTIAFFFIDSLQALEHPSDVSQTSRLKSLIDVLCQDLPGGPKVKTYFTTDGSAQVLARAARDGLIERLTSEDEIDVHPGDDTMDLRMLELDY